MLKHGPSWGDLFFLTWWEESSEPSVDCCAHRAYSEISTYLRPNHDVILQERIFGRCQNSEEILTARESSLDPNANCFQLPPTFVEGAAPDGRALTGIQILGIRGQHTTAETVLSQKGTPCGRAVTGQDADYLSLNDVAKAIPNCNGCSAEDITRLTFSTVNDLLEDSGWSFKDVVRTWFYLDDILAWYDGFNQARNQALQQLGVFDLGNGGHLPASTGISGRSIWGAPCTLDLLALRPKKGSDLRVKRLNNPRQNEAPEYGSAFSRGQVVSTAAGTYILASGTAAIGDDGSSLHSGDFTRQTETTLDTVESLIASAGASLSDIVQGTAFIKRTQDESELRRILKQRGLDDKGLLITVADVCRNDLLFELDATAVLPRGEQDAD